MLKKRIKIYLLLGLVLLIASFAFVWWRQNQPNSKSVDWDNPDYVFNIKIPADFDQFKIDRLQAKIAGARQAYNEKKDDNYTWDIIGNMYQFARDYERALLAFQRSLAKQPQDLVAILNIATIHEEYIIDYQEAEKYYAQAITIFPDQPDLYDRLARLYWLKMNKLEDAETIYLQGLEKTSGQVKSLLDLIDFYEQTGQVAKQKIYVTKLLELYPDNAVYQKEFGGLVK